MIIKLLFKNRTSQSYNYNNKVIKFKTTLSQVSQNLLLHNETLLFMNKLILFTLILSFSIFQTNLFSQCNSVSGLNIDDIVLVSGDGTTCNYTASISLVVSSAGNASACLVYMVNGLETKTCWNSGVTLTNQTVTFDADCGELITLSGFSSPNGSGNSCNGAVTFSPPLPVELISFKAKQQNSQVLIEWTTASEENNDYILAKQLR